MNSFFVIVIYLSQVGEFLLLSYSFDLSIGLLVGKEGVFSTQLTCLLAVEVESFLNAMYSFFGGEFSNLNNIDIHCVRIFSLQGIWGKGLVGVL